MRKLVKTDWLKEGLKILSASGYQKITIDNLCTSLKITKGSFYHHFKNIENYIEELMKYWQNEDTLELIRKTEQSGTLNEKQKLINDLALSVPHIAEQAIRAWSFSNAIVRHYLQQVDTARLQYLTDLNIQERMDSSEARIHALLGYATMIGVQQLLSHMSEEEFKNLYQLYISKTDRL